MTTVGVCGNLLGIRDLDGARILHFLDQAEAFREIMDRDIKKVPTLRGKVLVNMFFEPSTRTMTSFELAGKILSADVVNFSSSFSSLSKGESIKDTARTLMSLGADVVVVRHPHTGVPEFISRLIPVPVVNAGDGIGEHPTQALLDLYTVRRRLGELKGVNVTIMGDVSHSRVARSNIFAFTRVGARVRLVAPPTMLPAGVEELGVSVFHSLEPLYHDTDILYLLRIQRERQSESLVPSLREYSNLYGVNAGVLSRFKKNVLVMHPGPINRGVEISADVADGLSSLIEEQVRNGVVVRMAALYLLTRREG
ncbi:MAG: aspartate carbamoyltransferase catalytic subunit [bacterium]